MITDMVENEEDFNYCKFIDVHIFNSNVSMKHAAMISVEHGFRGIVTNLVNIDHLSKEINNISDSDILPICIIDYPFGSSSLDVRNYSILSAKEKGAKEVEIVAPYDLILDQDFHAVSNDLKSLLNAANKANIGIKYVIDYSNKLIDDNTRLRMSRILSSIKTPLVSTSLGFYDKIINHSDNIIKIRDLKSRGRCKTKIYIPGEITPENIATYAKAGTDIIGLDIEVAPNLVHAYQNSVNNV
jgi:deoxyribose-phosphate aldolase